MLKLRKNSNMVLVRKERTEKVGDVLIPQKSNPATRIVVVIDKADGVSDDEKVAMGTIKKGDRLLINKFHGAEVKDGDEIIFAIDIGSIQAFIRD